MEKAILKTLIYANIFDYPLKAYEIHKWLIGKQATLRQVEKALNNLKANRKVSKVKDYYFLPGRAGIVRKRQQREKQSAWYIKKAQLLMQILKFIPWIKLVGISGGLAMKNASKRDDIDLFIITAKSRLWISRLLVLGLLTMTGQRRKVGDFGRKIAGKVCINTLLEEDKLEQNNKDTYLAHEVLQMKVLWQRDGIYQKYLESNLWAFKFLPNWVGPTPSLRGVKGPPKGRSNLKRDRHASLAMTMLENLAQWLQLKIMQKPQGLERIENGELYFYPKDCRLKILKLFQHKISRT